MAILPEILTDQPSILAQEWKGYLRKMDPTVQPFNTLTFPSINCTLPDTDKIIPDLGKTVVGHIWTQNSKINGNKKKFTNLGGLEMEVRVWRDTVTVAKRDVIEVLFQGDWVQITEDVNPIPLGVHRFSMDDWWDSNLDPSQSKNLSRLIWVNGYIDPLATNKGQVYSWTGGIVVITNVTATNLEIGATTTWRSLGFTENAVGDAYVVVSGTAYQLTDPTDLDTNSIDITSTVGISIGDIATSQIEIDATSLAFDFCVENKGYMYYGNWKFRKLFQSNAFNRPSDINIISFSGGFLNDLTIPTSANFTGTGSHVYHVAIDSVTPPLYEQSFFSNGGSSSGSYNIPVAYTDTGEHEYVINIVSDVEITPVGASVTGTYTHGQVFEGATSGSRVQLVAFVGGTVVGGAHFKLLTPGVYPSFGETFQDVTAPAVNFFDMLDNALLYNTGTLYKDGVQQILGSMFDGVIQFALSGPYTLMDGLEFTISTVGVGGNVPGDSYTLNIQTGQPDTFKWWVDSNAPTTGVTITGGVQNLSDGVQIQFGSDTGHTLGDLWNIQVNQSIDRAWVNFYYTLPVRKPGEGYIFQLPSNFWTMGVQEEQVYVNTVYGQWSIVETELSGDLQSEAIRLTPLKQASANKVIDPWMIGHLENDLVYVTVDKNLDYIGRLELYQLPQVDNLSDPVKNDFLECSFVGGGIEYIGKRLYVNSPAQGIMLCYDKLKEYWQPPKVFPEMGIPSIIGNNLVVHSDVRNQTFTMFTNVSDNGSAYPVRIRTPYTDLGNRWKSKNTSMSFVEGYIQGNPTLTHRLYLGVNGCAGIFPHTVEPPSVCVPPDRAPFGEGGFGSHSNGSDMFTTGSYFQEIWKGYQPILNYYLVAFELECISKNHTWSLLTMGINAIWSNSGNNTLVNRNNVVQ